METGLVWETHIRQIYNVLSFGLCTTVASFNRAMDVVLRPEVQELLEKYLDDILISSATFFRAFAAFTKVLTLS